MVGLCPCEDGRTSHLYGATIITMAAIIVIPVVKCSAAQYYLVKSHNRHAARAAGRKASSMYLLDKAEGLGPGQFCRS